MDKRNIHAITNIFSTTENTKIAQSFKGLSTSFLFQKKLPQYAQGFISV